jgi:stage V sporulation protein AC
MASDNLTKLDNKKYEWMQKNRNQKSNLLKNCVMAFLFGGGFCIIAQGYKHLITSGLGVKVFGALDEASVSAHVSLFMIFLGSFLTAINVYDNIGKYAGAGSVVPITGFANSVVSPAMEFRSEGHILGVGAQIFVVAGPVIVYGTFSSVIMGLIYYLFTRG